jgi:plasmid stability protein
MPAHAVTLHLPDSLYDHFKVQAKRARRTLEAELLRIVETAAPPGEVLPAELEAAMTKLESCSDEELWQAASSHLSREENSRLESLHLKRQSAGLSADEKTELGELLDG